MARTQLRISPAIGTGNRALARLAGAVLVFTILPTATSDAGGLEGFLIEGGYSKPIRWNVGGSLFLATDGSLHGNEARGVIVGGSVGRGGAQIWGGLGGLSTSGGGDIRAVVTRTWANPRGASDDSTYIGGEASWSLGLRLSVGYAKRVSGPSTADDHIVTWGVGIQAPWAWGSPAKDRRP